MHKLRINPLAKQDLLDIKEYITNELDNPTSAYRILHSRRDYIKVLLDLEE